jgi:hypothetical protein
MILSHLEYSLSDVIVSQNGLVTSSGRGDDAPEPEGVHPVQDAADSARDLALVGVEHLEHYRQADENGLDGTAEAEQAVAAFERAVALVPAATPEGPAYRYNLALGLQSRYDVLGDLGDLDASIRVLREAIAGIGPDGSRYEPMVRYLLGSGLRRRFADASDRVALGEAIGLLEDALAVGTDDNPDLADFQYEYGRALLTSAEEGDDATDLDKAIRAFEALLDDAPAEAADRAAYLDAAGSAYLMRHEWTGDTEDLERAVWHAQAAVQRQRDQGRVGPVALSNLAQALHAQAIRHAVPTPELEEALTAMREALEIAERNAATGESGARRVSESSQARIPGLQSNLAGLLLSRLERTGDLNDLDGAVWLCQQAVNGSSAGSPELGARAHQLAIAQRIRFLRTDDRIDLTGAVAAHQLALGCPLNDVTRRTVLNGWANTLRTRFDAAGDVADLRSAVHVYEEALTDLDPGSPDQAMLLNNLGATLSGLAVVAGEPAEADRAAGVLALAARRGGRQSLERVRALINLGNVLSERFGRTDDATDRDGAEAAYAEVRRHSLVGAVGHESIMQAALNAGEWAEARQNWVAAGSWFELALDSLDELLVTQRRRPDKESWLRDVRGIATRGAAAALEASDPHRAVAMVERGRALLLNEATEQARLDLDRLDDAGAHALRARFEAARDSASSSNRDGQEVRTPRLRDAGVLELRGLRDEIRNIPGLESFLAAPTFQEVARAASARPIVYLVTSVSSGFALVVRDSTVSHVRLPELSDGRVREQVDGLFAAYEGYLAGHRTGNEATRRVWVDTLGTVSEWLWRAAAQPLLTTLRRASGGAGVCVVAGGLLGLLPLHAASRPDPAAPSGRRYLLDEIPVSYLPNARSLAARRDRSTVEQPRLLSVVDPRPSSLPALPCTAAESAVAVAAFGPPAAEQLLRGPEATLEAVRAALPTADVVLFGCHGRADLAAPLESALLLSADVPFTLGQILALHTDVRLAVLSACETARPGTRLPDEVVSLPAGLIQAGASGVVAPLWAVPDGATSALVIEFFRRWRWRGEQPGAALAGAQAWLRDTTNAEKVHAWQHAVDNGERWLPESAADVLLDVYLRREPDALDDATLDVWAGFAHMGS